MPEKQPTLIYDGDCGFCKRSLTWGQRHLTAFPRAIASSSSEAQQSGLTKKQLAESIWIIGIEKPLGAAEAAAFILRLQPNLLWRLLGVAMTIWPISLIAKSFYFWVAKNRGKW
jgi:predicted DCC family thiol-disulfide oxidoreductase YuxK